MSTSSGSTHSINASSMVSAQPSRQGSPSPQPIPEAAATPPRVPSPAPESIPESPVPAPVPIPALTYSPIPAPAPAPAIVSESTGQREVSLDLTSPISIHAIANARIYHTHLTAKKSGSRGASSGTNNPEEWTYSRLKGTLKFGQNYNSPSSSAADPYTARRRASGDSSASTVTVGSGYYFALADDMTGKTIWMFQIPAPFLYEVDRPFFHVFNGRTRKYGFLFEDDDEAALFAKKVINETCKDAPLKRGRSLKSRTRPSFRSQSLSVTTAMISAPAPNSFRHVSHIGVSKGGQAFEVSRTLDATFKEGLSKLQLGGLGNRIVVCESSEFLASFWRDVDKRSQSTDEPTASVASHAMPLPAPSVMVVTFGYAYVMSSLQL